MAASLKHTTVLPFSMQTNNNNNNNKNDDNDNINNNNNNDNDNINDDNNILKCKSNNVFPQTAEERKQVFQRWRSVVEKVFYFF